MQKLWVVLKVSLTRPWVWLMLVFGVLQMIPLGMGVRGLTQNPVAVAIPAFDVPGEVVMHGNIFQQLQQEQRLGTIVGLDTRFLEGVEWEFLNKRPNGSHPSHASGWTILEQTPQLKSLTMQPPNMLSSEGWRRIGNLSQLEELTLMNIGAVDQEAQKTAPADLEAALSRLTKLRQLDLRNAGGSLDWKLPPLPSLEYVVLGSNLKLENSLETLATSSPQLHQLAIESYQGFSFTERMQAAIRRMPKLRSIYVWTDGNLDETNRQVEYLRSRLPAVLVVRGNYSAVRVRAGGLVAIATAFLPFLFWFQTGLMMSLHFAAVMPGHRRPHLFWPVCMSVGSLVVFLGVAIYFGVIWPVALAMGCLITTITANTLGGHDIRPDWKRITGAVQTGDGIAIFSILAAVFGFPSRLDAFLIGDYPVLSVLLMFWFLFAAGWKVVRMSRLDRILAESGQAGVPGLNLTMQGMQNQSYKPASKWSLGALFLSMQERSQQKQLARLDRTNFVELLRAGVPRQQAMTMVITMLIFVAAFYGFLGKMPGDPKVMLKMIVGMGGFQCVMMFQTQISALWVGRRGSIASDFLRPVSREQFWSSLRWAIFHDMKPAFIFAVIGVFAAIYLSGKASFSPLIVTVVLCSTAGLFAVNHGWLTLMVVCKRLWLHGTLAVVTTVVLFAFAGTSVMMTIEGELAPIFGLLLSISVLLVGVSMQVAIHRRLPRWELA